MSLKLSDVLSVYQFASTATGTLTPTQGASLSNSLKALAEEMSKFEGANIQETVVELVKFVEPVMEQEKKEQN